MSSIYLLSHPTTCSQEQFVQSLKDLADSKTNSVNSFSVLPAIDASQVVQCVVGPNHLAFLMQDGRSCRVAYHTTSDKPTYSSIKDNSDEETTRPSCAKKPVVSNSGENTSQNVSFTLSSDALNTLTGTLGRWTHRVNVPSSSSNGATSTNGSVLANRVVATRGRGRIIRATRGRAGTGWLSSRAVIPALAVPEELISQAQVVLQGKSRQIIIRELQKTSLDVNLAVNNLLSRDDDEPDDQDDDSYMQDTYVPSEDLMSIFEAGIPGDEPFVVQRDAIFPEDLVYNPSYSRVDATTTSRSNSHNDNPSCDDGDKEFSSRIRDRWWGMLMMDGKDKATKIGPKAKESKTGDTSYRFGEIEWWTNEKGNGDTIKFVQLGSLYSELIAVCSEGFLHQWYWSDAYSPSILPNQHNHVRVHDLNITNSDKIVKIAASNIRITVLADSGKMSTWLDKTLAAVGHCLEHQLQSFSEFRPYHVTQLQVCDLYSCVQLSNGQLYWWGVFPYEQRKKILDKVKTKAKKSAIAGSTQVKPGSLVCIRSCPLYYPGAIGFTTVKGEPKVGKLLDKAWNITEKCRFRIIDIGSKDETVKQEEKSTDMTTDANNEDIKNENSTENLPASRKRKHLEEVANGIEEEEWCLQDVIFVEEVRNVPVGEVLKVDGAYAMVHFSSSKLSDLAKEKTSAFESLLKECVIRRKDELQIVKWTTPPKMPECYQKTPKQLTPPISSKIISITLDRQGVHAILRTSGGLRYTLFSLATGRADPGGYLQHEPAMFLSKSSTTPAILLNSAFETVSLLQDTNGCLYPLLKDNLGGIQNPNWLNLPSISCYASGTKKALSSLLVVNILVVRENELLQNILKCDVEAVEQSLKSLQDSPDLAKTFANTKCDGNRNMLHVCVSTCQPSSNKAASNTNDRSGVAKDGLYEPSLWVPVFNGFACLDLLLSCAALKEHLHLMLSQKDAFGYTPFMIAVRIRAYGAALKIYDAIISVATDGGRSTRNNDKFISMICPVTTDPDMSPLHMLCCNDTCSFTWTGTKHINQDIFECKTCGLVGPLCCCTECAQVCHIGHECKLKHTSPTAYCDCWEKCPCKALVAGDQVQRIDLLHKLIDETDLATKPNKKGQHILLFLVQTVARQANEQSQYVPNRMPSNDQTKQRVGSASGRCSRTRLQSPPPDHELEPPKFAKLSLAYALKNWTALKSMILFGYQNTGVRRVNSIDDHIISASMLQPDQIREYLESQDGVSLLDNFVHKILVKCNGEFLEHVLQTLEKEIRDTQSMDSCDEVMIVTRRFIRAVIRVYVVLTACTGSSGSKKKSVNTAISSCKRVFVSLNVYAAQELARVACSIFAPVCMGVVYPTAPFPLGNLPDNAVVSDELFSASPLPERNLTAHQSSSHRVRFAVPPVAENIQEEDVNIESQNSQGENHFDDSASQHESDMEVDLMAESDSDSEDSNNEDANEGSNISTNSSGTGRRSRRSNDGYFSTAEASETDGEEEEEEVPDDDDDDDEDEDEEEDEEDDDGEQHNTQENPETRNTGNTENNLAPQTLQWAVRNNQNSQSSTSTSTAAQVSQGSGLVFIDTSQLRRSAASVSNEGSCSNSMFCTPSALARTFGILIRELSDILCLSNDHCNLPGVCLPINDKICEDTRLIIDEHLLATWQWLWNVMETTEAQLRFGASLTAVSDPNHPQHPLFDNQTKSKTSARNNAVPTNIWRSWNENRRKKRVPTATSNIADSNGARQEYLTYILSLMRSHAGEHGDSLPKVEITSLRHVAYILDAFIYYLRSKQPIESFSRISPATLATKKTNASKETERFKTLDDDEDDSEVNDIDEQSNDAEDFSLSHQRFFKRSDSTLVVGYEPSDPYNTPLKEALPVADRPHLLNPTARRDQLFGVAKDTNLLSSPDPPLTMKLECDRRSSFDSFGHLNLPPNMFLGRWHMCLELFARVFLEDVGAESSSVLNELGRFEVKEGKFRRELEKLRNNHQKDLYLEGLDRSRTLLLQQSLRQLNSQFGRRLPGAVPLNVHRLKVSFKDEPGEGSGVVRSFYTAISNAFLTDENLPKLDSIFIGSRGLTHQLRARAKERERRRNSGGSSQSSDLLPRIIRKNDRNDATAAEIEAYNLSIFASPFNGANDLDEGSNDEEYGESGIPIHKREFGRRIFKKLLTTHPEHVNKITGMLLELSQTQLIYLLTHEDLYKEKVNEALNLLTGSCSSTGAREGSSKDSVALDDDEEDLDNEPLFYQPGKPGYYSPRPGKNSSERLNCMRNVGRIVGLCLLQNEICPLSFNRHVIKYMLGRKIGWHDLAFFDPTLYESLRQLLEDAKRTDSTEFFSSLDLTYCVQLRPEEGGGSVDLIKGGNQVEVAPDNVLDYVRRYAEYRMVTNARRALQAMRRGLLDVIPSNYLEGLTAEDFRLLLNGAGDINVQQLMSYTFFNDETGGEGQEKLSKFKKWFWTVVENMTAKQKQDLLYFWTSSPAMPASAEGFQPMPSVTVKPANDHQLPTANTCISRLYVPLYSSKAILRNKFLLAIKTKVFGFV